MKVSVSITPNTILILASIDFSQQLGNIICITDSEEAAQRDASMMAELAARNHEPITGDHVHLGPGVWCENTAGAGELSVQGFVEVDGSQDRFDQAVGQGWMIVGYNADPANALTSQQLETLHFLNGRTITLGSKGSAGDAIDIEGTYADWLASIDCRYFIVRPDFYLAASAKDETELSARFDQILQKLHIAV